jgi:hypothetical protein
MKLIVQFQENKEKSLWMMGGKPGKGGHGEGRAFSQVQRRISGETGGHGEGKPRHYISLELSLVLKM